MWAVEPNFGLMYVKLGSNALNTFGTCIEFLKNNKKEQDLNSVDAA